VSGFDPKAYAAEEDEAFDPKAYGEHPKPATQAASAGPIDRLINYAFPEGSAEKAGALGFAQGGTSGFADELGGLIGSLALPGPGVKLGPNASQEMRDFEAARPSDYQMTRDLMRREAAQASKDHKGAYLGGEVAGGIAQAIATPGKAPKGFGGVVKQGALYGAAQGLGSSNSEGIGGMAADTAIGAGTGAGTAAALYGAAKLARPLLAPKRFLQDLAAERAVKATGAIQRDIKGQTPDQIRAIGRKLLDNDVISTRGVEDIGGRAAEQLERQGTAIGAHLEAADKAAKLDWDPVLWKAVGAKQSLDPLAQKAAGPAWRDAATLFEAAKAGDGFAAANRLKTSLGKQVNWADRGATHANEAREALYGALRDEIDDQAANALGAQAGQEFKSAKDLFGAFKFAKDAASRASGREIGNRFLGPSDMGMAASEFAGSMASGRGELPSLGKAALLAMAHKLARERGSAAVALGANKLAPLAYRGLEGVDPAKLGGALGRYVAPGISARMMRTPEPSSRLAELIQSLQQDEEPDPNAWEDSELARSVRGR
jgi:hypothetical protein